MNIISCYPCRWFKTVYLCVSKAAHWDLFVPEALVDRAGVVQAEVWQRPAEICLMFLPCRAVTRAGSFTGLEWPRPSCNTHKEDVSSTKYSQIPNYPQKTSLNIIADCTWASQLQPHAYTSPVLDKARMCSQPTAMSSMKMPSRAGMICGRLWFFSMGSGRPIRRSVKTYTHIRALSTSQRSFEKHSFTMEIFFWEKNWFRLESK